MVETHPQFQLGVYIRGQQLLQRHSRVGAGSWWSEPANIKTTGAARTNIHVERIVAIVGEENRQIREERWVTRKNPTPIDRTCKAKWLRGRRGSVGTPGI